MSKVEIIILAAGHGKRMQSEVPKALTILNGKPFIEHVIGAIKDSGIDASPIIIIGQKKEFVKAHLGEGYRYAVQEEQLGTGHAVMMARDIALDSDTVLILYADHPLVSKESIKKLIETHEEENATLTMATTIVPDFLDWRSGFESFGRIVRDGKGNIVRIVEAKDATETEKNIKEVNPAYMCFKTKWLFENLEKIQNTNSQGEYYLTDLVAMACEQNTKISSVQIDPKEALGVNTKEQLELLQSII